MVGEIFEPLFRALLHLIGAILRAIVEIVIRVLVEEVVVRVVAGFFYVIGAVIHFLLATADRAHHGLMAVALRITSRRRLAHAIVMLVAVVSGFSAAAGASATYHHLHPHNPSTSIQR